MHHLKVQDFLKATYRLRRFMPVRKPVYFIACTPKSASTFLVNILSELTGYKREFLGFEYERQEQDLYLPKLIDIYGCPGVVQQHVRATGPNLMMLNKARIRPVVLVRNIPDSVVSVRDHLLSEGLERMPGIHAPEGFSQFARTEQYDCIIDLLIPWYITFYVSWKYAECHHSIDLMWIDFNEVTGNTAHTVRRIGEFYGMEFEDRDIEAAIDRVRAYPRSDNRLNKGVRGRGREELSLAQLERINRYTEHYPDIDFHSAWLDHLEPAGLT